MAGGAASPHPDATPYRSSVMLPDPLHPAVVHFPIVLMLLLPLAAGAGLWAIRRGAVAARAWAIPLTIAAVLTASSWVAVETGEGEEERVEDVVAESALHGHEEAAERFLLLSGAVLALAAAGMLRGTFGRLARLGATAAAVGLAGLGVQVGHSGGNLVYRDGAASAYTAGAAGATVAAEGERAERDD
jgi:uncharacterized membrane protein